MSQRPQRFASPAVWSLRVSRRPADGLRAVTVAAAVPPDSDAVLDVGCGDGSVLERLAGLLPGRCLVGVDLHAAALLAARRAVGRRLALAVADAAALPLRDRSFAAVICTEVLEHLPAGVFEAAVGELARLARDAVIVSVPNRERLGRRRVQCPVCRRDFHAFGHLRAFSPATLRTLLPGFTATAIREIGPRRDERAGAYDPAWRRDRLPAALLVCPECGWEGTGRDAGITPGRPAARLASRVAGTLLDRCGRRRWLLAVYRRDPD
ncbi:MAG TPA: class I SAM-dependent methyltransferase [Candidatus Krumholzibacteria bacterium]|nr:class I SAM-dependent methyltransferase [Candidatus Krumholzibacteria bacterium]HPD71319.1 class I SAM-dependent methyltransferase [Candidatus Krumholzibacteria bacterium]HRY38981.1 class I SAM-dependent methyltransferase [Candidatus Krumholzibacteria bacterium]